MCLGAKVILFLLGRSSGVQSQGHSWGLIFDAVAWSRYQSTVYVCVRARVHVYRSPDNSATGLGMLLSGRSLPMETKP